MSTVATTSQELTGVKQTANPKPPDLSGATTYSVYVVEDHDAVRRLIVRFVDGLTGLQVVGAAASAEAALADPSQRGADVLLTDLVMPGMNGLELTRRLRTENPDRAIILLTAQCDSFSVELAFEAGARAYVLKDDPQALEAVVKRVLAGERGIVELGDTLWGCQSSRGQPKTKAV